MGGDEWEREGTGVNQPRQPNPKTPDTKPKGPEKPGGQPGQYPKDDKK